MTSLLPEVGMARWAHWAREPRDDADTPAKGSMQGGPRIAQLSTLGSLSELFTAVSSNHNLKGPVGSSTCGDDSST
eukprot:49175-Eustigmatos_ZCMA.PRE.1